MNTLEQHELFEIDVLQRLKSVHLLNPLVFGGGTMLRLCYGLNRYSADLDFWFTKEINYAEYQDRITNKLGRIYQIMDNQIKHYTVLMEIRSSKYPKRLKIEIRKYEKDFDTQDIIAYSKNSTIQVLLKAHTLEQTMVNKIQALRNRSEIRDAFDIEFLLRKGIKLPELNEHDKAEIKDKLNNFDERDFKIKLGSILDSKLRSYYLQNKFQFLQSFL
ncbi:MAG: nucleotidyl transferase AbiEii/AbiGii toxin family protein [Calditrichaceae bacterium]